MSRPVLLVCFRSDLFLQVPAIKCLIFFFYLSLSCFIFTGPCFLAHQHTYTYFMPCLIKGASNGGLQHGDTSCLHILGKESRSTRLSIPLLNMNKSACCLYSTCTTVLLSACRGPGLSLPAYEHRKAKRNAAFTANEKGWEKTPPFCFSTLQSYLTQ